MANQPICSIEECCNPARTRGFCDSHYYAWYRYGDPLASRRSVSGERIQFLIDAAEADTDECVLWPYAKQQKGYGRVQFGKKNSGAHIVACQLAYGRKPFPDAVVAHSCHTPACVNPRHLRWATAKENSQDMVHDGNSGRGTKNNFAKLSEDAVSEIYRNPNRLSLRMLAARHRVSEGTIYDIQQGRSWAWFTCSL